ncbi:MAG: helix-turn-helix domain-containing protein [Planctomycetota bacterium]|jgi:excisionase family DNA binding protein
MAKSGEFYTFDEVVRQLKIDENKLKRLVSEGEISAFREGDVMKFKRTEIDKISTKSGGSETSETVLSEITLEDEAPAFEESGETLTDDLVFESSDTGDKINLEDQAGMATEELSSQDTFIEDAGDEIGMTTEPIDLSADLTEEVEDEEIEEIGSTAQRRGPARQPGSRRAAAAAEPAHGNPGLTFALVLSAIFIFLGLTMQWRSSREDELLNEKGAMRSMSGLFYDNLGSAEKIQKETKAKLADLKSKYSSTVPTEGGPDGN